MMRLIWACLAVLIALPFVSGAHFIVGVVNDAADGESADGKTVLIWNPANGISDNETDVVGPTGNSGASNFYLIDCELLDTPCVVGDEIMAKVVDSGDSYISSEESLTVTGAGFDVMDNLTLNSLPSVANLSVDDSNGVPPGEIDLVPMDKREVVCQGVLVDYDGQDTLANMTAEFYDNTNSFFGDVDDNNNHYTNSSCFLDGAYGSAYEVLFNCTFQVEYYANAGEWDCTVDVEDNLSVSSQFSNSTQVNVLLALSIESPLDFGELNTTEVGPERELNVSNAGNAVVNLSLSGYGDVEGDGLAYSCEDGPGVDVGYMKYNLSSSNSGEIDLNEFEQLYYNLTSNVVVRKLDLNYRTNDTQQDVEEVDSTFWRVYVPSTAVGNCSGNLVFGAVQMPSD